MTTQTSISLELLYLLNWFLRHDKAALEAMVKRALANGFAQDMEKLDSSTDDEQMYTVLFDLFEFLEDCLVANLSEVTIDAKVEPRIIPMLQKLERSSIDVKTLLLSMQQTTSQIHDQEQEGNKVESKSQDVQDVLVAQLLKNWKPDNSETVN